MTDFPAYIVRRLLVVDDDDLLRGLLSTQIRAWGFEVAEARSSRVAVDVCQKFDPDGVLLDVDLGQGLNGFQLAEALVRRFPHLGIVFLTRFPDARASISRLSPALREAAYVNKSAVENSSELLDAINAALTGRGDSVRHDERRNRPLAGLTKSQLEVLRLVHEGLTNAQIADVRRTSVSAVEKIVSRVFHALGIGAGESNARARAVRAYSQAYGNSPVPVTPIGRSNRDT